VTPLEKQVKGKENDKWSVGLTKLKWAPHSIKNGKGKKIEHFPHTQGKRPSLAPQADGLPIGLISEKAAGVVGPLGCWQIADRSGKNFEGGKRDQMPH